MSIAGDDKKNTKFEDLGKEEREDKILVLQRKSHRIAFLWVKNTPFTL